MPKVSVVIPSYDCAAFVGRAVQSVLAQTMPDYEVIVVDDGSRDNTREVLEPYFDDPRFRYVRQENRGLPGARNTGVRASDSEYLAFLDADDALAPAALERMEAALDGSAAGWCLIDILKVGDRLREVRPTVIPDGDLHLESLREDFIRRAMFFRRTAFIDIGMYDEDMRYREDWDLNIRMLERRAPFAYVGEPLYLYTWREGSITTGNHAKLLYYTRQVLRKHHKRLADAGDRRAAKLYAYNMWDLARRYVYLVRDYRQGLACMRESLAYDLDLGRLFHPIVHHARRLPGGARVQETR
jgi:glycosyltransferase involved in cell wall biosynthesis